MTSNETLNHFLNLVNPIQVLIFVTFLISLYKINFKNLIQILLFLVLLVSFSCEFSSNIFILLDKNFNIIYNICFILNNSLWIFLIIKVLKIKYAFYCLLIYIIFCLFNLFLYEKENLNYLTFIFGAILYLFFYIVFIKHFLEKESTLKVIENELILISAPVFIFIGLALIFSFRNSEIIESKVFYEIYLYDLIIYSINLFYYSFIFYYLIKLERR